uniref:7TM_GPCR_Srx domain-containing protein n=1 Tax=Parastrongyloides trichosuri TaxID=131310 RepID=A0A0N4ZA15_PARTI
MKDNEILLNSSINFPCGNTFSVRHYVETSQGSQNIMLNRVLIGSIHLGISSFFLITQILVFYVSFFYKEYHYKSFKGLHHIKNNGDNMPFTIMKHQGFTSFIQQICHFITSILTIVLGDFDSFTESYIGALLLSSYSTNVVFVFLLTLNRVDIMYQKIYFIDISRETFFKSGIFICYIIMGIFLILFLLPPFRLIYNPTILEWVFFAPSNSTVIASIVQSRIIWVLLFFTLILNLLIFFKIISLRRLSIRRSYFAFEDFKLILHVILCYASIVFLELCWNGLVGNIYKSTVGALIPQIIFIITSGANAIFTLCFVG